MPNYKWYFLFKIVVDDEITVALHATYLAIFQNRQTEKNQLRLIPPAVVENNRKMPALINHRVSAAPSVIIPDRCIRHFA